MGITQLPRPFGALRTLQRALSVPVLLASTLLVAGCGDPLNTLQPASFENIDRQYGVYAISGTPAGLPAGYQFTSESLVRPQLLSNGVINFDVAFDLTANGDVLVMSARRVVPTPPSPISPIGFQRWAGAYEQLERAPDQNYVDDTVAVLKLGESIAVRITGSGCFYRDPIYAKLTIDSINVAERRMLVRSLINRNCGYRALTTGVPTN